MNLLMLTKCYPYGTGEAFIENEIPILAEYFEQITIIACEVPAAEKRIRPLPEKANACRVLAGKRAFDLIGGLAAHYFSGKPELMEEYGRCAGIMQRMFLSYFEAKSRRVYRCIRKQRMDEAVTGAPFVLYSYWLFVTARAGAFIGGDKSAAHMICRAHGYDLYAERNKMCYLPFRPFLLNAYDSVFPCSDHGTAYLKARYPSWADKVRTAHLGTTDHGTGFASTDGRFRIVSCSRIAPEKRVERILGALSLLEKRGITVRWTHIGAGKGLKKLKAGAKKFKYVVCSFPGNMPNSSVLEYYRENPVDLFLNVSRNEGLPVSIMEAMSFGIPVAATDVGGTAEIVSDNVNGRLLRVDFTDEELAEVILEFAAHRPIDRASCRAFWEAHFRADVNYRQWCECMIGRMEQNEGR